MSVLGVVHILQGLFEPTFSILSKHVFMRIPYFSVLGLILTVARSVKNSLFNDIHIFGSLKGMVTPETCANYAHRHLNRSQLIDTKWFNIFLYLHCSATNVKDYSLEVK
jgi:hypothetical protein